MRVEGSESRVEVEASGFKVQSPGFRFRVQGLLLFFFVITLTPRVECSGFRVQGLGSVLIVWVSGFRV